jgi:hypothetical protein
MKNVLLWWVTGQVKVKFAEREHPERTFSEHKSVNAGETISNKAVSEKLLAAFLVSDAFRHPRSGQATQRDERIDYDGSKVRGLCNEPPNALKSNLGHPGAIAGLVLVFCVEMGGWRYFCDLKSQNSSKPRFEIAPCAGQWPQALLSKQTFLFFRFQN